MKHSNREHSLRVVAVIAVLFGLLTLASGGRVLFGSDAVRQAAGTTAVVFAVFALHVWQGGAYELRTAAAMALRLAVWAAIAWVGYRRLWRSA
jgi:hypothetical protein